MRIDSHQHFWDPDSGDYPWMEGPTMTPIRRIFGPSDLKNASASLGVTGAITVQCRHDLQESEEMLATADADPLVVGVVGWADLTSGRTADDITHLRKSPGGHYLVGIRHIVHDEPDANWLDRADVRAGLAAVFEADLTYDLLLKPRDMPAAIRCVEAMPQGRFVIDHGAKPRIGDGGTFDSEWAEMLTSLASFPNTWCKLSGLVTEADWATWSPEIMRPYVDAIVTAFGPHRLMFGSDWPVCTLASEYERVVRLAELALEDGQVSEDDLFVRASTTAYKLPSERNES